MSNTIIDKLTESQLEGRSCLNCGAEISQKPKKVRRIYCSISCGEKFRYWSTSAEIAEIRKHFKSLDKEKLKTKYTCKCCGKEFEYYKHRERFYCSKECSNTSHSYKESHKQVTTNEIRLTASSFVMEQAFEMLEQGFTVGEIVQATGCGERRVYRWKQTHDERKSRDYTPHHRPPEEPYYRYIHTRSPVEWLAALNDEMYGDPKYQKPRKKAKKRNVILACNTVFGGKGLSALLEVVQSELKLNPADGNTYAFCSIDRDQVMYFTKNKCGFQFVLQTREYGRFIWASSKLGETISLTQDEFDFILMGSKNWRESKLIPKNT